MRKMLLAAAGSIAVAGAAPASAATYNFSYLFAETGNLGTGSVEGTLGADNNTFTISGVNFYAVNGMLIPGPMGYDSTDNIFGGTLGKPATATLDGSVLDFGVGGNTGAVFFGVGDQVARNAGTPIVGAYATYGGNNQFHAFVSANYRGGLVAAVPEPATWAMMVFGFGAVGFAMRHRRRTTTVSFA